MVRKSFVNAAAALAVLMAADAAWADFGPLGPDAESLGKGGACVASAEGPSSAYWNPAGAASGQSGFAFLFSFGMLQRPDFSVNEYGATGRLFLGMSWVTEGEEAGKPGILGLSLAFGTPYPRFEYNGTAGVDFDNGGSGWLTMKASEDYSEIAAAAALTPLSGIETPLGGFGLSAGLGLGLGFTSCEAAGGIYSSSGMMLLDNMEYSGISVCFPVSLGVVASLKSDAIGISLGIKYRGVISAGSGEVFDFQDRYSVDEAGAFMPPPQEGVVGVCATFFKRISYSLELSYLFFDAADEFPNLVPHNYPTVRFGFEYRAIGSEEGGANALFLRFGFSQSIIGSDAAASIFTSESTGFYLGIGVKAGPVRVDFFFTQQIPGEGDVDTDATLAGISVGIG